MFDWLIKKFKKRYVHIFTMGAYTHTGFYFDKDTEQFIYRGGVDNCVIEERSLNTASRYILTQAMRVYKEEAPKSVLGDEFYKECGNILRERKRGK